MEPIDRLIVIGAGSSGQSAAEYFAKKNLAREIVVYDSGTKKAAALTALFSPYPSVQLRLGENPSGEEAADLVLLSPGIAPQKPFVERFYSRGICVTNDMEMAWRLSQAAFVGITGTNGKTTTTALTTHILRGEFENVYAVGNIGCSALQIEGFEEKGVFLVSELSSFQLETLHHFQPVAAAILNLTEDHLDRHATMENYQSIKYRIAKNLSNSRYLVLNREDPRLFADREKFPQAVWFSASRALPNGFFTQDGWVVQGTGGQIEKILPLEEIPLPGQHNIENVLAACALAKLCHVSPQTIRAQVKSFVPVEHRCEIVKREKEILYINDSKATNPDSTLKAIQSLPGPIILIAGGFDKGSSFEKLAKSLFDRVRYVIAMGATGPALVEAAQKAGFKHISLVKDLPEAVTEAFHRARAGDTVLLSPACASWDAYPSYEARGAHFKQLIRSLTGDGVDA